MHGSPDIADTLGVLNRQPLRRYLGAVGAAVKFWVMPVIPPESENPAPVATDPCNFLEADFWPASSKCPARSRADDDFRMARDTGTIGRINDASHISGLPTT